MPKEKTIYLSEAQSLNVYSALDNKEPITISGWGFEFTLNVSEKGVITGYLDDTSGG